MPDVLLPDELLPVDELPLAPPGVADVLPLGEVVDVPVDVLVSDERDGDVVDGDADGFVPLGRSPTRSERDSVQPVSTPAPRASTQRPESNFFITQSSCE